MFAAAADQPETDSESEPQSSPLMFKFMDLPVVMSGHGPAGDPPSTLAVLW